MALQACVLLPASELPAWLRQLVWGDAPSHISSGEAGSARTAGMLGDAAQRPAGTLGTDVDLDDPVMILRLPQIAASADLGILRAAVMDPDSARSSEAPPGLPGGSAVPFLLRPLLEAPTLVQGSPGKP